MKIINGEEYLKIGEVAELIDRSPLTIKNWYEWAEQNDCLYLLPDMERVGVRQIRYYKRDQITKLLDFRDSIKYGTMSDFNQDKWGDRNIKTKRSRPFDGE